MVLCRVRERTRNRIRSRIRCRSRVRNRIGMVVRYRIRFRMCRNLYNGARVGCGLIMIANTCVRHRATMSLSSSRRLSIRRRARR